MKRALRYCLGILAILAIAAYLFGETLLAALGSYLVDADEPHKADVALVLAGDSSGRRILKGAQLVRDGYVSKVLVSGPSGFYGFYECDLAIPLAVKAGYPESYFEHFEHEALSTAEEAKAAAEKLRQMGAHKVLIVTTDFHTRRAGRAYRTAAPDLEITMVAATDEYFTPRAWWRHREGQKTWLYESLKTVAAWFGI